ncbi:MAG: DUF4912 domain-containing protein [Omnitrophica WOR_2 bacterium]
MVTESRLIFLVKDPHWTFLWWEFPIWVQASIRAQINKEKGLLAIRVYDVTHILFNGSNAHSSFYIDVSKEFDHYYLNILASDRNYLAEIGIKYPEGPFMYQGPFQPLVRSNTIYLPRDHASEATGNSWSTITL